MPALKVMRKERKANFDINYKEIRKKKVKNENCTTEVI